ncbi:MAG: N-acetyltransferase [Cypionkella sp.]
MAIMIHATLPPELTKAAAELYWQAFGGKLGMVMGPDKKALRYLCRILRNDHAVAAIGPTGELLGVAGFKTPQGSFAGGEWSDMVAIYGWFGTLWRSPLLALLAREVDNERFLLDGVCVAKDARGQGIGSALLEVICTEARGRGYGQVRLDVIDTNWRAKALYERLGFKVLKIDRLGLLRHIFGFASSSTMVKDLAP